MLCLLTIEYTRTGGVSDYFAIKESVDIIL